MPKDEPIPLPAAELAALVPSKADSHELPQVPPAVPQTPAKKQDTSAALDSIPRNAASVPPTLVTQPGPTRAPKSQLPPGVTRHRHHRHHRWYKRIWRTFFPTNLAIGKYLIIIVFMIVLCLVVGWFLASSSNRSSSSQPSGRLRPTHFATETTEIAEKTALSFSFSPCSRRPLWLI
jgi:hypothetical protein